MKTYGLIGKELSHSFSKNYFTDKFSKENRTDVEYKNFELDDISDLKELLKKNPDIKGLNVTTPYKESVISQLDKIENTAQLIGAVNTIKINDEGELIGYNTDFVGFWNSLKPFLAKEHSRALIFGTGGSSRAVAYVLQQLQIPFSFVSRKPEGQNQAGYSDLDATSLVSYRLLINCTPVGMSPNEDECLPLDFENISFEHLVYDLIYNPEETLFLKKAKEKGALTMNGLSMLKLQAEESWNIWES